MTLTCFLIAPLGARDSATRSRCDFLLHEILIPALDAWGVDVFHADHVGMPGSILRHVVELLVTADLVVADLTDSNPNVMYELALRHCTGKPVIQVSQNIAALPFDVAGERTIPVSDFSPAGVEAAIREVRQMAERLLTTPSLFTNPVTVQYQTVFTRRDTTVLGDWSAHRSKSETRPSRPSDHVRDAAWKLTTSDSLQESMLRVAHSQVVSDLAKLMLQRIQLEPYTGRALSVAGTPVYVLQSRVPGETLPPLNLVYVVEPRKHLVVPLGFFTGGEQDGSSSEGTPSASGSTGGAVAREAQRLLQHAGRSGSWH